MTREGKWRNFRLVPKSRRNSGSHLSARWPNYSVLSSLQGSLPVSNNNKNYKNHKWHCILSRILLSSKVGVICKLSTSRQAWDSQKNSSEVPMPGGEPDLMPKPLVTMGFQNCSCSAQNILLPSPGCCLVSFQFILSSWQPFLTLVLLWPSGSLYPLRPLSTPFRDSSNTYTAV